jgi:hypothetical protein
MNNGIARKPLVLGMVCSLVMIASGIGCGRDGASASASPGTEQTTVEQSESSAGTVTAQVTADASTVPTIARIVFVGKEEACDCTRGRIDASWAELQAALSGRTDIPIEQLLVDTQEAAVAPYEAMRSIMVLPAVYFLDSSGGLIEMLQGEITQAQFADVLDGVSAQ